MLEKILFNEFLFLSKISDIYFINLYKNYYEIIYLIFWIFIIHILFYYLWKYIRLIFNIKLSNNNIIKNIYFFQFFPILWFFSFLYLGLKTELNFKNVLKYVFSTKIIYYSYFILTFILVEAYVILNYETLLEIIREWDKLALFFHTIFPFIIFLIFLLIKILKTLKKPN